ncbi:unnamed protein product [Amoebophrya sp. A25]|nr:unnamed protein product [Amoebophrya sp. A25]|eukprot:GSA25T00011408001.1
MSPEKMYGNHGKRSRRLEKGAASCCARALQLFPYVTVLLVMTISIVELLEHVGPFKDCVRNRADPTSCVLVVEGKGDRNDSVLLRLYADKDSEIWTENNFEREADFRHGRVLTYPLTASGRRFGSPVKVDQMCIEMPKYNLKPSSCPEFAGGILRRSRWLTFLVHDGFWDHYFLNMNALLITGGFIEMRLSYQFRPWFFGHLLFLLILILSMLVSGLVIFWSVERQKEGRRSVLVWPSPDHEFRSVAGDVPDPSDNAETLLRTHFGEPPRVVSFSGGASGIIYQWFPVFFCLYFIFRADVFYCLGARYLYPRPSANKGISCLLSQGRQDIDSDDDDEYADANDVFGMGEDADVSADVEQQQAPFLPQVTDGMADAPQGGEIVADSKNEWSKNLDHRVAKGTKTGCCSRRGQRDRSLLCEVLLSILHICGGFLVAGSISLVNLLRGHRSDEFTHYMVLVFGLLLWVPLIWGVKLMYLAKMKSARD